MMDFRNSAKGHLIALESEDAIGYYLEDIIKDTFMKQRAYRTLASSEMHAEPVDQLVILPWRAVSLRNFEKGMRTNSEVHALIAITYVRTEVQIRLTWCLAGLTTEKYDSEERKRSKDEKVFLMMALRKLMKKEEITMACAKRRDALCCIRVMLEQMSAAALSICAKVIEKSCEPKRM